MKKENYATSMEQFESKVENLMKVHQIPGLVIGLNREEKRIYEKGFGFKDADSQYLVDSNTLFGIASMTKSFTCVAIMQLHEAGKINIHHLVTKYLPEFTTPNLHFLKEITIHHLMTHTAGIPPLPTGKLTMKLSLEKDPSTKDYPGLDLLSSKEDPITTYKELVKYLSTSKYKMLGRPGSVFSYSNDSYSLLGAIISRVSGETYENYIINNILKPANMNDTIFSVEELKKRKNVATLFARNERKGVYAAPMWWDSSIRGAGGLKSTVNDILKFTKLFVNEGVLNNTQILTKESIKKMIYPHVQVEPGKYYGYGFMVTKDYYGSTLIEHGGSSKGVSSLMCMIPEKKITSVALTNLAGVQTDEILLGALNIVQNRHYKETHQQYKTKNIKHDDLHIFVGSYTSEEGARLNVEKEEEGLVVYSSGIRQPLTYIGNDNFLGIVKSSKEIIQFVKDGAGEVERIAYHYRQVFKDE